MHSQLRGKMQTPQGAASQLAVSTPIARTSKCQGGAVPLLRPAARPDDCGRGHERQLGLGHGERTTIATRSPPMNSTIFGFVPVSSGKGHRTAAWLSKNPLPMKVPMLHGTGAMRGSLRVHSLSDLALFVGWSLVSHVRWRWAGRAAASTASGSASASSSSKSMGRKRWR